MIPIIDRLIDSWVVFQTIFDPGWQEFPEFMYLIVYRKLS